jgi:hypothetical protein
MAIGASLLLRQNREPRVMHTHVSYARDPSADNFSNLKQSGKKQENQYFLAFRPIKLFIV